MLEYFTIKKLRKNNQPAPPIAGTTAQNEPLTPLLAPQDEHFLAQVINRSEGEIEPENIILPGSPSPQTTPTIAEPLAKSASEPVSSTAPAVEERDGSWKDSLKEKWGYLEALGTVTATRLEEAVGIGKGKGKEKAQENKKEKEKAVETATVGEQSATSTSSIVDTTPGTTTPTTPTGTGHSEIIREDRELTDILERLNCAASNGIIFSSPSASLKPLIAKFTQIFKDLMEGVPTAYDDLVSLFDSSSNLLEKTYTSLPTFLKQLIASLPDKMTPEVLRTLAATSPALANVGRMGLKDIVTTPGVLANLLKSIVQVLKLRFPMLLGGGVAVGLGMFVLFFGLWYCYKRGREERVEREERERMGQFGIERIKTEKELQEEEKKKKKAAAEQKKKEQAAGPAKKRWWQSK